ncbi:uncharacterized protein LOC105689456 [Athalia rosae]|uniref:uncharacterized protein LOC105689456 n=1 Tax=Athalia rosae TaxID=37344 RepID=UPI0020334952|nr:uncharacterized protein LOC105689456 [Athalia rosae]
MTKVRKQKRRKRFRANVNRKRLRNKLRKLPKIECKEIEGSWEVKKSIRGNLDSMGLAYDPNEVLKIPSTKHSLTKSQKRGRWLEEENMETDTIQNEKPDHKPKIHVANALDADAKAPRERLFRLPKGQVQFVTYLMEKYGDDFKAMARDRKNHYQMTWCQIRSKINTFKSIPEQYAEYLLKTGEIVLDDPTPLEETRKKIGIENANKFSVAKKRKIPKEKKSPLWDVESINNEQFGADGKTLHDETDNAGVKIRNSSDTGLKKLQLFPDDESDEENVPDNKIKSNKTNKKDTEHLQPSKKKKVQQNENVQRLMETVEKQKRSLNAVQRTQSSDSDSEDEEVLDGDDETSGFVNLSDMSEDEALSEDDILDDGEFVTDSNDEGD